MFWHRRVDADSTLNHPRLIPRYVENAVYLSGRYYTETGLSDPRCYVCRVCVETHGISTCTCAFHVGAKIM